MNPSDDSPMLLEASAEYLHVSQESLREMVELGIAPAAKLGPKGGRKLVFTKRTLDEFVHQEIKRQTEERRKQNTPAADDRPAARSPSGRRRPAPPPALTGYSIS